MNWYPEASCWMNQLDAEVQFTWAKFIQMHNKSPFPLCLGSSIVNNVPPFQLGYYDQILWKHFVGRLLQLKSSFGAWLISFLVWLFLEGFWLVPLLNLLQWFLCIFRWIRPIIVVHGRNCLLLSQATCNLLTFQKSLPKDQESLLSKMHLWKRGCNGNSRSDCLFYADVSCGLQLGQQWRPAAKTDVSLLWYIAALHSYNTRPPRLIYTAPKKHHNFLRKEVESLLIGFNLWIHCPLSPLKLISLLKVTFIIQRAGVLFCFYFVSAWKKSSFVLGKKYYNKWKAL